jgi:anaerobic selenocysteine-containing dehydrogenase
MPEGQLQKTLGLEDRPLGPARSAWVTSDDVYRAILRGDPYEVRAVVGFGANLVMSHADVYRGREALQKLDFMVHLDLFMNPTAELADIVLPVTTLWEHKALRVGFEPSAEAHATVQLRPRVVEPEGEARSDTSVVFELARRIGLGEGFWEGDIEAAYDHVLEPSGISVEDLRRQPGGRMRIPLEIRYRKYEEVSENGCPSGFATPTGKVEVYSQTFLKHGYPPIPEFEEPAISPISRPDLAEDYPLVLTCAKLPQFCHSQHRAMPSLRKKVRDPGVDIHPSMAEERGIEEGDWVVVETPEGRMRARARFNNNLHPRVVVGQYGWWQGAPEIDAPAYDPYSPDGPNYNLLIGNGSFDPISGSVPHRAYVCQIKSRP